MSSNSLNEKSILITGGAGFLGSHLGNKLKSLGADVRGIDSYIHNSTNPLQFYCERGDVRWDDLMLMRMKDADAVIHLAALVNVDFSAAAPDYVFDVNLDGTLVVLEAARKLDKQVIFASSSEVYGTCQPNHSKNPHRGCSRASAVSMGDDPRKGECGFCGKMIPWAMDESHPLDGQSPYAASKIAADRACKAWADCYGMDIRVLRCFNLMGPYQANDGYGGVIARFTKCALDARPMPIFGDGSQRRDYTYIDDAVDAYILALTKKFDGPLNVGSGTTVSISDVARDIHEIVVGPNPEGLGKSAWTHAPPRPGEVQLLRCDATKAKQLGWSPKVSFQEGLSKYIEWAKSN